MKRINPLHSSHPRETGLAVNSMKRIGEKLATLRKQHGYSARQLAEMLGVTHTHILRIEKGDNGPSASLVFKMSQIFDVSADKLLNDELDLERDKKERGCGE